MLLLHAFEAKRLESAHMMSLMLQRRLSDLRVLYIGLCIIRSKASNRKCYECVVCMSYQCGTHTEPAHNVKVAGNHGDDTA